MVSRGAMRIPRLIIILVVLFGTAGVASALDKPFKYPVKVNVSDSIPPRSGVAGMDMASGGGVSWDVAAGQFRGEIFCPKRGYSFAIGMKPFFTSLIGASKVSSRGGEGSLLSLHGHLRLPDDKTLWDFYSYLRLWDKVAVRIEYAPWSWSGPGHIPIDANFSGLALKSGDAIQSDLGITTFTVGADYDVSFGRDLVFGPNADMHVIKWSQRVVKDGGTAMDFSQTILQPAIGAHIRYEPTNTGYFSWFKPYLEGRFTWMSFDGLGLSTWDASAGIAPPVSRNVDAGFRLGYKQWRLDGTRNRLFTDVTVEGPYMDFALHF
ncbi:MAG: hypothetical protein PHS86_01390 [Syntrophaceae bacterium]|nr:hypothetical protein [Syntrophaceae bacterium]